MIIKDVSYVVVYKEGTEDEITFHLKRLKVGMVSSLSKFINEKSDSNTAIEYSMKLIENSLADWDNVVGEDNVKLECNIENFKKLPFDVFGFLSEKIIKNNNLVKDKEMEEEEKN